jgi:hypothetical protein
MRYWSIPRLPTVTTPWPASASIIARRLPFEDGASTCPVGFSARCWRQAASGASPKFCATGGEGETIAVFPAAMIFGLRPSDAPNAARRRRRMAGWACRGVNWPDARLSNIERRAGQAPPLIAIRNVSKSRLAQKHENRWNSLNPIPYHRLYESPPCRHRRTIEGNGL